MLYLLDSGALIRADRQYYPPNRFPIFWTWLFHIGIGGSAKVAAYAFADGAQRRVVTLEASAPRRQGANHKIPDECAQLGIARWDHNRLEAMTSDCGVGAAAWGAARSGGAAGNGAGYRLTACAPCSATPSARERSR